MKYDNAAVYTREYRLLATKKQEKLRIVRKAERFADKVEQMLSKKAPPKQGS